MIMVGRSLVCGRRGGAPSPIPRPRAGGLPERRHERPGARAGVRGRRALAARAARAGPQQQGVVRAPDRADRRAPRAHGAAARRDHSRRGAHGLDDRRHQRRAPRGRHQAGRRDPDERRGAPRRARPDRHRTRHARRHGKGCAVRRPARRGARRHAPRRDLARVLGHRQGHGHRAARRQRRARRARRGAGPRRGPGGRARARLRLLRRVWPEVAVRPGRHGLPVREPGAGTGTASALERLSRHGVVREGARARAAARRAPARHRLPGAAPRGVGARVARRVRGGRLRRRAHRGHRGSRAVRRDAPRPRHPRGGPWRHHARLLRGAGTGGLLSAGRRTGDRDPLPPEPAVGARLGRRLEHRRRARAPGGARGGPPASGAA